ncbi:competence protein CoiA family protein [Planococcus shenhongbingii]|uniref:DUF3895 domain-containing protein n=1 Tax=Planococcus shenhongbingii TaxID=3058398 RepID=UPI00262F0A50|nr:competence protein CoiA family protein [Planococcus sp. N016]WKA56985.1 competence protein CoiA family protein [Planococcus sp. N016]
MLEAIYEGERFNLHSHLSMQESIKAEVNRLKKAADKGAFTCPYCNGILKLKAGDIYEKHFFHPSNSCSISEASETYQKQIKRESKKHSVMKEIIYDELKTQEKINDNLRVEYGYIEKADEKWKYYPDIIIENSKTELAITILTDVTETKDSRLVQQIKKRNKYFKTKNLKPIWFVEETEQSVDMDRRVIHLWEAELDIAVKMKEDLKWEDTLNHLKTENNLFDLFNYHHQNAPRKYEVFSLYYVKSTETNITFTIQRFLKDQISHPYRAFALNEAYEIKMATALLTEDTMQLSDPLIEAQQRESFLQEALKRDKENVAASIQESVNFNDSLVSQPLSIAKRYDEVGMQAILDDYIKEVKVISASELSKYLVKECGAPSQTYLTGKYQIYTKVCIALNGIETSGKIKLIRKDFVDDRIYEVIEN